MVDQARLARALTQVLLPRYPDAIHRAAHISSPAAVSHYINAITVRAFGVIHGLDVGAGRLRTERRETYKDGQGES